MKIIKTLLIGAGVVVGLIIVGMILASRDAGNRQWYLSVVNSSPAPVTLSVSLAEGAWTVGAGEAKTLTIGKQKDEDQKKLRTLTLTYSDGRTESLETGIGFYENVVVLDVTGDNCLVLADYSAQYRSKEAALPEGEPDIKLIRVFQGQRLFPVPMREGGAGGYAIRTNLGEKLPESVKISQGADQAQEYLRLVTIPCATTQDPAAFYDYLNTN